MMAHDNRSIRQAYGVDRAPDDKTAARHRLFQLQGSRTRIGQARAGWLQDPEDHPDDAADSQHSKLTRPALSHGAVSSTAKRGPTATSLTLATFEVRVAHSLS